MILLKFQFLLIELTQQIKFARARLVGGLIGIGLGWVLATLVGVIAANSDVDLSPAIGIDAILLATLFSTAVGLFFGLYPAKLAADLEPVEALRYE